MNVELSFDMRLSMDAWFVAKIHQQEQSEETTSTNNFGVRSWNRLCGASITSRSAPTT
jgi:hypothetical protein